MQKLTLIFLTIMAMALSGVAVAKDDNKSDDDNSIDGREWQNHAPPYTFLFGNYLDTHQETRLKNNGDLYRYLYITWTGDRTEDGDPIAEHCTTDADYAAGCFVGWTIKAKPCIEEVNECRAMFFYHLHDHPVWMIGPRKVDEQLRGTRDMIPQPGSYTHLHWLTDPDFLQRSPADVEALFGVDIDVPEACNKSSAGELTADTICPGYFLQTKAVEDFAFKHGGENLIVRKGVDNKTHLNIATSYRSWRS